MQVPTTDYYTEYEQRRDERAAQAKANGVELATRVHNDLRIGNISAMGQSRMAIQALVEYVLQNK